MKRNAMAIYKRGKVYWCSFIFAGQRVQASTKSHSKTVAKEALSRYSHIRMIAKRSAVEAVASRNRKAKPPIGEM
jgi:hypothetical protein